MISTTEFQNGVVIVLEGDLMEIIAFQYVKPGKGGAVVRTRLKEVTTGRVLERVFWSWEEIEQAELEQEAWQFLYRDGDLYHFVREETYEQLALDDDVVGAQGRWLVANTDVTIQFHRGHPVALRVPFFVELTVVQCDGGVAADEETEETKPAVLETGVTVLVPLFVQEGEIVKVDTRTGAYLERVS